jgi:hypothetical protein
MKPVTQVDIDIYFAIYDHFIKLPLLTGAWIHSLSTLMYIQCKLIQI